MIDSLVTGKLTPQAEEPAAARHDDSTAHRKLYQEMVWVFPGSFLMGSDAKKGDIDEIPRHKVALDGFYIDKYEVSRESFERVMGYNPSKFNGCPNCPIDNISWFEADEYCRKSEKRLPTEAEWEYACRAGGDGPFNTGSAMGGTMANFNSEIPSGGVPKSPFRKKPVPCGSFKPNTWNLYDMHGNVWEWCADWYDIAYYGNAPEKNPRGPKDGRYKVARGGGWDSNGDALRSANRISYSPEIRMHVIGFRCVKDASE
jgi:formylglycine-generating enzyme required for sulfatase activity